MKSKFTLIAATLFSFAIAHAAHAVETPIERQSFTAEESNQWVQDILAHMRVESVQETYARIPYKLSIAIQCGVHPKAQPSVSSCWYFKAPYINWARETGKAAVDLMSQKLDPLSSPALSHAKSFTGALECETVDEWHFTPSAKPHDYACGLTGSFNTNEAFH